jgi:hypothetical protein
VTSIAINARQEQVMKFRALPMAVVAGGPAIAGGLAAGGDASDPMAAGGYTTNIPIMDQTESSNRYSRRLRSPVGRTRNADAHLWLGWPDVLRVKGRECP